MGFHTGHTAVDAWTDGAESAQAIMELLGARVVVPRTRCKLYARTPRLGREVPFYQMKKRGAPPPERDARELGDDDVFAENGFYFVCQGVDLRKCPADDKLPMGVYEEHMAKKHVGAYLCRRVAALENRPDVAAELLAAAQKLDWGTKGWDEKRSFTAEDFLCQMSPTYHAARVAFRDAAEERRLDVLRADRKDFREARLAAKAARAQLDDAEAAAEVAQDALEASDMRAIAAMAARFDALLPDDGDGAGAAAPPPLLAWDDPDLDDDEDLPDLDDDDEDDWSAALDAAEDPDDGMLDLDDA